MAVGRALVLRSLRGLGGFQSAVNLNNSFSCRTLSSIRLFNSTPARNFASVAADRYYSDKHEWVEINGNVGTVGISQYAQEALGDIVYAQLPDEGSDINKDDEVGALESVKAASELYSPVSGKVAEKNTLVENTPALVNQSCYDKGWLFKVTISNKDELKDLMNEEQYTKFLKTDRVH